MNEGISGAIAQLYGFANGRECPESHDDVMMIQVEREVGTRKSSRYAEFGLFIGSFILFFPTQDAA